MAPPPSRKRRNISRNESKGGDPLIARGGKVDPAAVFRAAKAEELKAPPVEAIESEDLTEGEGDATDGDIVPSQPTARQKVSFTLTRDLDKRLDKYLTDRITFLSRNKLQELIDAGGATVNARPGKASTKLRLGDVVEVQIEAPAAEDYEPQDIPLEVMFEDEHMIVLNKSPDIIVHPARTHTRGTLINALAYHFRNRSKVGGQLSPLGGEFARPGVVHRLDRQTSGVIVFAKSEQAHWQLAQQFEKRTADKRYLAFVHGRVEPLIDVMDEPMGPHPSRQKGYREKQVVRHDHLGKPAVTIYRVLGRCQPWAAAGKEKRDHTLAKRRGPIGWEEKPEGGKPRAEIKAESHGVTLGRESPWVSVLEVELKTGRTHQIRVHCAHRDHPLLGDDMYGGRVLTEGPVICGRVGLHAAMLAIHHPVTRKKLTFMAPLPADLRGLLATLRKSKGAEEIDTPPGSVLTLKGLMLPA